MTNHEPTAEEPTAEERRAQLPGLGYADKFAHGDQTSDRDGSEPQDAPDESADDVTADDDSTASTAEEEQAGALAPPPPSQPWHLGNQGV